MLETFLKGNCSKTLTSLDIATNCIFIIIILSYIVYLMVIYFTYVRLRSASRILHIKLNWTAARKLSCPKRWLVADWFGDTRMTAAMLQWPYVEVTQFNRSEGTQHDWWLSAPAECLPVGECRHATAIPANRPLSTANFSRHIPLIAVFCGAKFQPCRHLWPLYTGHVEWSRDLLMSEVYINYACGNIAQKRPITMRNRHRQYQYY